MTRGHQGDHAGRPVDGLPVPVRLGPADVARTGLAGLSGRPLRAVLSGLGIAIGIAAMIAVLGIGAASRADLLARIDRLGTNLLTVSAGQTLLGESAELPAESAAMVARIAPVTSVTATGNVAGVTVRRTDRIDPEQTGGIAVAAARVDLLPTLDATVRTGAFLNDATARYPAVVLGSVAAGRLGIDAPGRQVYLGGDWFTVVGILAPVTLAPEIDRSALVGWPAAQRYLAFDGHPSTIYERSTDDQVDAVRSVLAATVNPEHPEQVRVSRPSDALTAQLAAKSAFTSLFLGLGAVALLVGGVGVANTMVISVLERRQEIGLRRALGATRGQVGLQFLTESVALASSGGAAGVVLGVAGTAGYAAYRGWPVVLSAPAVLGALVLAVVVGTLAGGYPAVRAARLTPTEALAGS